MTPRTSKSGSFTPKAKAGGAWLVHFGRFAGAAAAVAGVTIVSLSLGAWIPSSTAMIFSLLAVTLISLVFGTGPGILATLLAAAAGAAFFPTDRVHLAIFLAESLIISIASGIPRKARDKENKIRVALEQALDSGALASWSLDIRKQVYTYGGAFEQVFGRVHSAEVDEAFWNSRIPREDSDQIRAMIQKAITEVSAFEMTFRFKPDDGPLRWIALCGRVHCDENGIPSHIQGVNSDVTAKKNVELTLARAKADAEAASAAKSTFLANMSHEIRTPLGVVLGFSEVLATSPLSAGDRARYFEIVRKNGQLLASLVNEILDLSKIESGKLEVDFGDVELRTLIEDVRAMLQLKATEKGLKFEIQLSPELPERVRSDALRLKQILVNVIGNAIKFTEVGAVMIDVRPTRQNEKQLLEFEVRDSGIGLSEAQQARLFEPFNQADASTTRRYGGTGLGLAIAQRLARRLGGDVALKRSEIAKGSTFVVTVEAASAAPQARSPAALQDMAKNFSRLEAARILVVEDSEDVRHLLRRTLEEARCQVSEAPNGLRAVALAKQGEFDLILMDLQMPEMDGYEAIHALRRAGYRRPVVGLSAHAMATERKKCLDQGFDDFLTKPIERDVLLRRLSSTLAKA